MEIVYSADLLDIPKYHIKWSERVRTARAKLFWQACNADPREPIRSVLFAPDSQAPRHWPGAGLMAINYKRGHWLEAAAQDFLDYRHNIKPTKRR